MKILKIVFVVSTALILIIMLILFGFYLSTRGYYLDTFVARNNLTNLEEVSVALSSALPNDIATYQDTLSLLESESTNCIQVASDSRNFANWFSGISYDASLICFVPLAVDRFEWVGFFEVIFSQPTLRIYMVFLDSILQDYSLEVVRTGL